MKQQLRQQQANTQLLHAITTTFQMSLYEGRYCLQKQSELRTSSFQLNNCLLIYVEHLHSCWLPSCLSFRLTVSLSDLLH